MPSPFTLKVLPLGVPAGIFREICFLSVGILIVEPSAASVNNNGTSKTKSLPFLLKYWCGSTAICTRRSPSGAPLSPGPP